MLTDHQLDVLREPSPYAGRCGVLEARMIIVRVYAKRLLDLANIDKLNDDDLRAGLKYILETVERPVR